jgi:sulfite reductase beta subunit-like hemoprotein
MTKLVIICYNRYMVTKLIDEQINQDIKKFEILLDDYLNSRLDEDSFRIFRLNNGIYGQRQGGHNQMVRVKLPYGSVSPEQLEVLGDIATKYSRGWGHITTRQNIQFHFVQLEQVVDLLKDLASVNLTTREACGDTVRNVMGCHLAGACPQEVLDISPWAQATFDHFLRHPYAQRLPRKFKINFSGCVTDCGQAMFNDVGVVAVNRTTQDNKIEAGFRVFIGGGLGANPHPAQALEEFTERENLIATIEATLRTFDHYGNRDNKLRARLKWVIDNIGIDELRRRILKERQLLIASSSWPGGVPELVALTGDSPAGKVNSDRVTEVGTPVTLRLNRNDSEYDRWKTTNVIYGSAKGTVSVIANVKLGDITSEQFYSLASIARDFNIDVRTTNRQNLAFRSLTEAMLPEIYERLKTIEMAGPGAEMARDVVSCPGADTCNLAVTQSRGLASDISEKLEEAGLGDVGGIRINISGCTNSCGQHHIADIGFHGVERRAHDVAAPGYQLLLGGHVGQTQIEFGKRALRLPAKAVGDATVVIVKKFAETREAFETFAEWLERSGGAKSIASELKHFDEWPDPQLKPDYYIDFDETGPYVADVGIGECAGS